MKKLFRRNENGDIALISIFASLALLSVLALIIDVGMTYYQWAKLQNAVDATTYSVMHEIENIGDDSDIQKNVETYMSKNRFDITEYGEGVVDEGESTASVQVIPRPRTTTIEFIFPLLIRLISQQAK